MLISSKKMRVFYPKKNGLIKTLKLILEHYQQASKEFDLNEEYFEGKGGVFMCDSRDYLTDFSLMNEYIRDYLYDNPQN